MKKDTQPEMKYAEKVEYSKFIFLHLVFLLKSITFLSKSNRNFVIYDTP